MAATSGAAVHGTGGGIFRVDKDEVERAALHWIESLGAPSIYVPQSAMPNPAVLTFVPTNDDGSVGEGGLIQGLPQFRRHRAERRFPGQYTWLWTTIRFVMSSRMSSPRKQRAMRVPYDRSASARGDWDTAPHSCRLRSIWTHQSKSRLRSNRPLHGSQQLRTAGTGTLNRLARCSNDRRIVRPLRITPATKRRKPN